MSRRRCNENSAPRLRAACSGGVRRLKCALLLVSATYALTCVGGDHFNLPPGFSASDPKWYGQEVGDQCWLLRYKDQSLGYVTSLLSAGDSVLLEKCHAESHNIPGPVEDGYARGWFLATPGSNVLIAFELSGLDRFSAPLTCGTRVAYWGDGPSGGTGNGLFAYVAEVRTRSIVENQPTGRKQHATDWRHYLPWPRWKEDCSEVIFAGDRPSSSVRFTFPAEPYLTRYYLGESTDFPSGFSVRERQSIYEEDGDWTSCTLLELGNQPLGWVSGSLRADSGLLVKKCEWVCFYDEECAYKMAGKECRHGTASNWFVVTPERPFFRKIQDMESLSNPMPCGSRVAYWASQKSAAVESDAEYFGLVADLHSGVLLERALVGQARIASDHPNHLAYPRWKSDCSEVVFDEPKYFEPLSLVIGEVHGNSSYSQQ